MDISKAGLLVDDNEILLQDKNRYEAEIWS